MESVGHALSGAGGRKQIISYVSGIWLLKASRAGLQQYAFGSLAHVFCPVRETPYPNYTQVFASAVHDGSEAKGE
jgi:hypothetical protein